MELTPSYVLCLMSICQLQVCHHNWMERFKGRLFTGEQTIIPETSINWLVPSFPSSTTEWKVAAAQKQRWERSLEEEEAAVCTADDDWTPSQDGMKGKQGHSTIRIAWKDVIVHEKHKSENTRDSFYFTASLTVNQLTAPQ